MPSSTQPTGELAYGVLAVQLGFTTAERIKEAVVIQHEMRRMGVVPKKLGEILMERGHLTEEQARMVFRVQGQRGGHVTIEGYRVVEKIGQGAMGTVFKAIQLSMDRPVAIKVLAPKFSLNARFLKQFLVEARAVAKLSHSHVIQGIDVGESNGLHYFVMEFVDGQRVGDLIRRGGALEEKRATRIVLQIAKALDHAYEHGLVHRDVKPDNILVDKAGVAKLCDLGLAQFQKVDAPDSASASGSKSRHGTVGTPNYMAPEQARGEDVDIRTDIYSLGSTFYHMVVGQVPFPDPRAPVVISRHLTEEPKPPYERNPAVSGDVSQVILKMMAKDPKNRYQKPQKLIDDLERVLVGQPVGEKQPFRETPPQDIPGSRPKRPRTSRFSRYLGRRRFRRF